MARIDIHNLWDRDMRTAIDQNFIELYNEYTQAGLNAADAREKAVQAVAESLTANLIADEAKSIAERVSTELGQAILEGDSSPLGGQLSVGSDGTVYNDPQDRFVKEMNSVNQQLAHETNQRIEVDNKAFYNPLSLRRNVKAQLSFIDDDAHIAVWSQLKPIVEQERVPINLAVPTNRVGVDSVTLTLEQLKELQKLGFETSSHTHNHINLRNSTPELQHEEMRLSKEWLQKNGFESDAIVYPFGARDSTTMEIARQYFGTGVYIDNGQKLNNTPVATYDMQRVYYNDAPGDTGQVQRCKDKIDEAIANNSWIIIGMHCHYDAFSPANLIEVIQYAKSKGIDIVSIRQGLERYANVIDLPNFVVDARGLLAKDTLTRYVWLDESINYSNGSPISSYPFGTSVRFYNTAENAIAGFANSGQGVLYTHRSHDNRESYQEFLYLVNKRKYVRTVIGDGTMGWSEWELDSEAVVSHNRALTVGVVSANSCKKITLNSGTYTPENHLSWRMITSLPLGVTVAFGTVGTNTGEFIFCNVTNSDIDCGSQTMRISQFTRTL